MDYNDLTDEIYEHPEFPAIVADLSHRLLREQRDRQQFYAWLRDDVKAEFINGEIVIHSPVKRAHLVATENLTALLRTYVVKHDLGEVDSEKALVKLSRNDYEPDIVFWRKEIGKEFDDETLFHPVPDFVVEVLSKSTADNDRGTKFQDYGREGVREYWIIEPIRRTVEQFIAGKNGFETSNTFHVTDEISSEILPNFRVPVIAIFDKSEYLKALISILK